MVDNIYILCGGISAEHEISLMSAANIINNLDREKYNIYPVYITKEGVWVELDKVDKDIEKPEDLIRKTDMSVGESLGKFLYGNYRHEDSNVFIPALHGTYGEDGVIQGFLEVLDIPYVGNSVLASAACMDKVVTNQVFEQSGIPQAKYIGILDTDFGSDPDKIIAKIEDKIDYPLFVKPANAGSSVGVTKVNDAESLREAIKHAFNFDRKILVEEAVIGRELEVSVIGNDFPISSLPGEHVTVGHDFFDYKSKYFDKTTIIKAPTEVTPEQEDEVRKLAVETYKLMGCKGIARVDIFMRDSDKKMLVNEINTFPGMTKSSLAPILWEPTDGTTYGQLIERLIEYALDEYKIKKKKQRSVNINDY
ncbi:MAG: D-alanine--D-alanine ligase family protein [Tissierellia bacterium]|nr:D-alanine--D-alanine ligase family protein [Tissierellia bacterium]